MDRATTCALARTIDHRDLLAAWELCQRRHRDELAVALLELFSSLPARECLQLPLGERDFVLLSVYKRNFSAALEVCDECEECSESVEFSLPIDNLLSAHTASIPDRLRIEVDGWTVDCRPLHSMAVIGAQHEVDPGSPGDFESVGRRVVNRLIEHVHEGDERRDADDLPDQVLEEVADHCFAVDPLAQISVHPQCPECGHEWSAVLDVTEFLAQQINSLARKLLMQIHRLASHYGWAEDAILGLSPARRAVYLQFTYAGEA